MRQPKPKRRNLRAHDVEWLPAPPPPPANAATSYRGPTGDVTDAEAVELVARYQVLKEQADEHSTEAPALLDDGRAH